jgi:hypothetical protein
MAIELAKEVRKPKFKNPRMQIIYSVPKAGKTTIISALPDHLILELEPGGADYVNARVQEITKPSEFNETIQLIRDSPTKVCEYLVVDTITRLDEWSEIVGTYNYMKKPQGKKFNREGEAPDGKPIKHTDVRFETVHSLGQGFGYQHSRQVMVDWYDNLLELIALGKVTYVILLAHVKDKLVESRNGDSVESIDINLTGKVKSIYASKVDAVGHFYREEGKGYISYNNEYKVVCGGRCPHLDGSILVSEKLADKSVKVDWSNIYLK